MDDGRLLHRVRGHDRSVPGGCDKNRAVTWRALLVAGGALLVAACGGGDGGGGGGDGDRTVTGRLMSLEGGRACVSPDRGETETCVDLPGSADDADDPGADGLDVGRCVTVDPEAYRMELADEAACAAGDLGDGDGAGGD